MPATISLPNAMLRLAMIDHTNTAFPPMSDNVIPGWPFAEDEVIEGCLAAAQVFWALNRILLPAEAAAGFCNEAWIAKCARELMARGYPAFRADLAELDRVLEQRGL